ncbi:DUF6332 family protein [Aquibaculum sediminis]|uniref:DUF6332 family protein n=1 Tax=Aquibaculum sediminis TaxID=3231907 RepID=UPI0034559C24
MTDWETRSQATRDAATVLPFAAAVLLAPPVVLIFAAPQLLFGIPLIVLYMYGVWAAAILAAYVIARRLERLDADGGREDADGNG